MACRSVYVSSGGLVTHVIVPGAPGFQPGFARRIRVEAGVLTAAVGPITSIRSAQQAEPILQTGQADMVLIGRAMLRNPYWSLEAAAQLSETAEWPEQYQRAAPPGSRSMNAEPAGQL